MCIKWYNLSLAAQAFNLFVLIFEHKVFLTSLESKLPSLKNTSERQQFALQDSELQLSGISASEPKRFLMPSFPSFTCFS